MSQPPPGESWKVAPGLLGLGAVFCVARVHIVACFVCEQCSVAPAEGGPSPVEGSLTLLHSVWLRWLWLWCFRHRHAPWFGGPPLFLFWSFLIPRSQEFPHLEEDSDRSQAANKMHLLLLMLPNLPMSVDFKFTDYSLFLLFFSTKQPDLISKIFSGLSLWKAQIWFSQALQIIHSRKLDFFFIQPFLSLLLKMSFTETFTCSHDFNCHTEIRKTKSIV